MSCNERLLENRNVALSLHKMPFDVARSVVQRSEKERAREKENFTLSLLTHIYIYILLSILVSENVHTEFNSIIECRFGKHAKEIKKKRLVSNAIL